MLVHILCYRSSFKEIEMTQTQTQETFIFNEIASFTGSNSAFDNIQRATIAACFARAGFEVYGKGMPKFNARIKALIEAGKVIRIVKGRNTYYSLRQAV
jgi:hypothetical protein